MGSSAIYNPASASNPYGLMSAANWGMLNTPQPANTVLRSSGGLAPPAWGSLVAADIPSLDAAKITTGTLAPARVGGGTPSATTYLRGDSTWVAIPTPDLSAYLAKADNLAGLGSPAAARANLLLGSMATATATDYLPRSGGTMTGGVFPWQISPSTGQIDFAVGSAATGGPSVDLKGGTLKGCHLIPVSFRIPAGTPIDMAWGSTSGGGSISLKGGSIVHGQTNGQVTVGNDSFNAAGAMVRSATGNVTAAAGVVSGLVVEPSDGTTGTAGINGLVVNISGAGGTGTGEKNVLVGQNNGTTTSKIDKVGNATLASLTLSGGLSVNASSGVGFGGYSGIVTMSGFDVTFGSTFGGLAKINAANGNISTGGTLTAAGATLNGHLQGVAGNDVGSLLYINTLGLGLGHVETPFVRVVQTAGGRRHVEAGGGNGLLVSTGYPASANWANKDGNSALRIASNKTATGYRLISAAYNDVEKFGVDTSGIVYIANVTTEPLVNYSGGSMLYAFGGAIKSRGSNGTVTTLGQA